MTCSSSLLPNGTCYFNFSCSHNELCTSVNLLMQPVTIILVRMDEGRGVHKVLVGKPEAKRPLRRPRRRWDDNS